MNYTREEICVHYIAINVWALRINEYASQIIMEGVSLMKVKDFLHASVLCHYHVVVGF